MFDIDVIRERGRTLLRLDGTIDGPTDDLLLEAFAFVQDEDHLILDLSFVSGIDRRGVGCIYALIESRSDVAETVIVSPGELVSMPLVLHNVDRVSSIVRSVQQAVAILDYRSAGTPDVPGRSTSPASIAW